jgi:hypothetical protein
MKTEQEIKDKIKELENTTYIKFEENMSAGSILATLYWVLGEV